MTNDELKVYIEKQIQSCKERIEYYEEAKKLKINTAHQDILIEMQMEQLDFYKTVKKDLEILEILLASLLKKPITNGTGSSKMILLDSESYDKIKELLGNE